MEQHSKSDFKTIILALVITFSLTSCNEIIGVMDRLGIIPPREQKLELQLERQTIGEAFSFADYCEEKYDSIFLVYSYFNIGSDDFLALKMSDQLRRKCNSNSNFDSLSTLLFIRNGEVEAYTEIENWTEADFSTRDFEKHYIFPFGQEFIMDKERDIHIYNE